MDTDLIYFCLNCRCIQINWLRSLVTMFLSSKCYVGFCTEAHVNRIQKINNTGGGFDRPVPAPVAVITSPFLFRNRRTRSPAQHISPTDAVNPTFEVPWLHTSSHHP